MFKLPHPPSPQAEPTELADFAELLAWHRGAASAREIASYLGQVDENNDNVGCDDNDDANADEVDEVMNEIERRASACGTGYPFVLEMQGTVLRHTPNDADYRSYVYRYLLLSTRLNMRDNRVHANIDGAHLLEELAANVLKCYLHPRRSCSIVFGTSAQGAFKDKVNNLCRDLGEGGCFRNRDTASVDANDDKLDAVAWVPFSDKNSCQLIIFAQCKTGTNWDNQSTQLVPDGFIKRWMSEGFLVDPLRAYCITEAANRARWKGYSIYSGLLLDRCRLVDFCEELSADLLARIRAWSEAAKATIDFAR